MDKILLQPFDEVTKVASEDDGTISMAVKVVAVLNALLSQPDGAVDAGIRIIKVSLLEALT